MKKYFRYRIYTEYINFDGIRDVVSKYFDGFTIYTGMGIWQGKAERNLTIEIVVPDNRIVDIEVVCRKINRMNCQACCMLTADQVAVNFI